VICSDHLLTKKKFFWIGGVLMELRMARPARFLSALNQCACRRLRAPQDGNFLREAFQLSSNPGGDVFVAGFFAKSKRATGSSTH